MTGWPEGGRGRRRIHHLSISAPQAPPTTVLPALRQLRTRTSALRRPGSARWPCWLGAPRQPRHGTRLPQVLSAAQLRVPAFLCALTTLVTLQSHPQDQL